MVPCATAHGLLVIMASDGMQIGLVAQLIILNWLRLNIIFRLNNTQNANINTGCEKIRAVKRLFFNHINHSD